MIFRVCSRTNTYATVIPLCICTFCTVHFAVRAVNSTHCVPYYTRDCVHPLLTQFERKQCFRETAGACSSAQRATHTYCTHTPRGNSESLINLSMHVFWTAEENLSTWRKPTVENLLYTVKCVGLDPGVKTKVHRATALPIDPQRRPYILIFIDILFLFY